ncbi:MAG TPA: hypothetical protein VF522_13135 [Ramlibacter sp.]|uniref:hypothetical protein n=1 Tax=Ramlibacter sp. TaxID=1917967 RepID=UPI002ED551DD
MSLLPDEQDQDALRPLRAFVGAVNGWLGGTGDQSYAGTDGQAVNPPRQFMTLGPQGISLEGTQTQVAAPASAGFNIPPIALVFGAGLAVAWLVSNNRR